MAQQDKKDRPRFVNPNNKYLHFLNNSIGKKATVVDASDKEHVGEILGFSVQHLNIVIKDDETGKVKFIRNIKYFMISEKE